MVTTGTACALGACCADMGAGEAEKLMVRIRIDPLVLDTFAWIFRAGAFLRGS
jgi:hypothetical protein